MWRKCLVVLITGGMIGCAANLNKDISSLKGVKSIEISFEEQSASKEAIFTVNDPVIVDNVVKSFGYTTGKNLQMDCSNFSIDCVIKFFGSNGMLEKIDFDFSSGFRVGKDKHNSCAYYTYATERALSELLSSFPPFREVMLRSNSNTTSSETL